MRRRLDGILAAKSINTHVDDSVVVASAALNWPTGPQGRAQRVRGGPGARPVPTAGLDALDTFDLDIVVSDVKHTVTVKRTGDASFDLVTTVVRPCQLRCASSPTALY